MPNLTIAQAVIEQKICFIRGQRVMLDKDLAALYKVTTGNLNKAVTRNIDRFPEDFMFRLIKEELDNLIFQNGTSSWGGMRKIPRVFTEHGILMLSSVLRSKRATQVNIQIMRTFVNLRKMLISHKALLKKIEDMEERYDVQFKTIFEAIRQLMAPPERSKRRIGFHANQQEVKHD